MQLRRALPPGRYLVDIAQHGIMICGMGGPPPDRHLNADPVVDVSAGAATKITLKRPVGTHTDVVVTVEVDFDLPTPEVSPAGDPPRVRIPVTIKMR